MAAAALLKNAQGSRRQRAGMAACPDDAHAMELTILKSVQGTRRDGGTRTLADAGLEAAVLAAELRPYVIVKPPVRLP